MDPSRCYRGIALRRQVTPIRVFLGLALGTAIYQCHNSLELLYITLYKSDGILNYANPMYRLR